MALVDIRPGTHERIQNPQPALPPEIWNKTVIQVYRSAEKSLEELKAAEAPNVGYNPLVPLISDTILPRQIAENRLSHIGLLLLAKDVMYQPLTFYSRGDNYDISGVFPWLGKIKLKKRMDPEKGAIFTGVKEITENNNQGEPITQTDGVNFDEAYSELLDEIYTAGLALQKEENKTAKVAG